MITEVAQPCGALCISIDLEALWGTWDRVTGSDVARCREHERPVVRRLLALLERYKAPATWAIVGRLVDDSRGFDGLLGPRDCWYAPDLVAQIRGSGVAHEIGSHSYGHVYFQQIDGTEAREDLTRASEVHRQLGLPFTSFVFPRNGVAQLEELRRAGLRVFRSVDGGILKAAGDVSPRLRQAVNLAEKMLGLPSPLVLPRVHQDHGLVELPSSTLLISRGGARRSIHPAVMRRKLTSAARRAAAQRKVFHLWFHPSNFYVDPDTQFGLLEATLAEAASLRDKGELRVSTMGDFAQAAGVA